jgi:hypothetical protein
VPLRDGRTKDFDSVAHEELATLIFHVLDVMAFEILQDVLQ